MGSVKIAVGMTAMFVAAQVAMSAVAAKPTVEMQKVLNELQAKNGKPIEQLSADEARKQPTPTDAVMAVLKKEKKSTAPEKVAVVKEIEVDGAVGKIPARLYRPVEKGVLPITVYYHGGGFVIADNNTYDASARALANTTKSIVISVEYRKAPENKFPAAHDDAFAAYKWALANAASINGDAKKVAVAGESAGANLAINVAVRARDEKVQLPVHELLVYPVAGSDMNTASYTENANAKPLNKPMMGWFFKNYTRTEADANDSRLNLLKADFQGLNPATVITAEIDPLMTEGKQLSDRMKAHGVKVNYEEFKGVTHEFFGMAAVLPEAKRAQAAASNDLKASFRRE